MSLRVVRFSFISLSLISFAACGGVDGSVAGSSDSSLAPVSDVRELASADAGYGTITFYETTHDDGSVTTSVSDDAPADAPASPLAVAAEGHTTLEVFLAVLPEVDVPESLLSTHAVEAQLLGRTNDDLVATELDTDSPVQLKAVGDVKKAPVDATGGPKKAPVDPGPKKAPVDSTGGPKKAPVDPGPKKAPVDDGAAGPKKAPIDDGAAGPKQPAPGPKLPPPGPKQPVPGPKLPPPAPKQPAP